MYLAMRIVTLLIVAFAVSLLGCSKESGQSAPASASAPAAASADFVLVNARVYTVDDSRPWAEALAVDGGNIVYVGSGEGVKPYVGVDTRVLRTVVGGKAVFEAVTEG